MLNFLGGDEFRTIANYLNRQGYQTLKKNKFTPTAVRDILQTRFMLDILSMHVT